MIPPPPRRAPGPASRVFLRLLLPLWLIAAEARPAVVVEAVAADGAAAAAGVRVDDVLVAWQRGTEPDSPRGRFRSPFEVEEVEREELPRGAVTLTLRRGAGELAVTVPSRDWQLTSRPQLADEDLATYRDACDALDAGAVERATALFSALSGAAAERGAGEEAVFYLYRLAGALREPDSWPLQNRLWEQALVLSTTLETSVRAVVLEGCGIAQLPQSRYREAEGYLQQAVTLRRQGSPESLGAVRILAGDLARLAWLRGDLSTARKLLESSLAIAERAVPGSLFAAAILNNLGVVARHRGDLEAAEEYLRRDLEVSTGAEPGGLRVAASLNNLASVAQDRGDLQRAEELLVEAVAIKERLAPASLDLARSLGNLGGIHLLAGDLDGAEPLLRRALAIKTAAAPGSLAVASGLADLAELEVAKSETAAAEASLREALEIRQRLAPGSQQEAETAYALARLLATGERTEEALDRFAQAADALESQLRRLGGSASQRTAFRAAKASLYRDYLALLIELERPMEAFGVLERSRARGFLAMLAERDLVYEADIPAELDAARRLARAAAERAFGRLGRLSLEDGESLQQALAELARARQQQERIQQQILAASPRLAELQDPSPVGLSEARALVEPGTLLLAWSLGTERSYLFALGPQPEDFSVFVLTVSEAAIRGAVERFRRAMSPHTPAAVLARLGERLRTDLLAPVEPLLAGAEKLILLPDGPLHLLPFAALPGAEPGRYLGQEVPISVVASVTVLRQLRERQRGVDPRRIVAFGDPAAGDPAAPTPDPPGQPGTLLDWRRLGPLSGARDELGSLRSLFGEAVESYLGAAATEERVKSLGAGVAVLHFATHAVVDERFPLESGLVLAPPGQPVAAADNGLLQVWEILEELRLDSELVVLSACRTALGEELAGEGIVGLTRAFQYAGAEAVIASLWNVPDRSTAALMERFYRYLRAGWPEDRALQRAQGELLAAPLSTSEGELLDASHPYYWSPFQLYGEGRGLGPSLLPPR